MHPQEQPGAPGPGGHPRAARRRHRQTELRARYLASLVESSDDAIIGKTLDGTIISWNAGAQRLYGYSAGEAIGRSIAMLFPPHRPPEELPAILEKLRCGVPVPPYETVRRHKNGATVEVAVTISPVKDHAGHIIGASSIARDITHLKREERERLGLIQELTDALRQTSPPEAGAPGPSATPDLEAPLPAPAQRSPTGTDD